MTDIRTKIANKSKIKSALVEMKNWCCVDFLTDLIDIIIQLPLSLLAFRKAYLVRIEH